MQPNKPQGAGNITLHRFKKADIITKAMISISAQ